MVLQGKIIRLTVFTFSLITKSGQGTSPARGFFWFGAPPSGGLSFQNRLKAELQTEIACVASVCAALQN
jgi:hypothetical protein